MAKPEGLRKLLTRLAELDDSERLAELAKHALHLDEHGAAQLLGELASGDTRERRLGLIAAGARRDLGYLWRGVEDPSLTVRRTAAGLAGRFAESLPSDIVERLDDETLGRLAAAVIRYSRPTADALLALLLKQGRTAEAARVLSACSPATIEGSLASTAWPSSTWVRLAKYAPDVATRLVERSFTESSRPDLVWEHYGSGFWSALAKTRPEALGRLIDDHADASALPPAMHAAITPLAQAMCGRVVGWLTARAPSLTRTVLPPALVRRLRNLEVSALQPLCTELARQDPLLLAHLLSGLPPARRGLLFDAAIEDLTTERTNWPTDLLEVLPEPCRDREAERMLRLDTAKVNASWRRTLLGFRSIEHARGLLEQDCSSAQADDRQQAYHALIQSTNRSRRGMSDTLDFLRRVRNEQDPVRMSVLGALAATPPALFDAADPLDAVIAPIFEARDTSYGTRAWASQIAHRLLIAHATEPKSPMFVLGLSLLERLAGQSGTFDLPLLNRNLPRGAEKTMVKALWPWLASSVKREQVQVLFSLWWALGKRAWRVPELGRLLEKAVWKGPRDIAGQAAELWLQDPLQRDVRVRHLLDRDASAIYLHSVTAHCHGRRQSLLEPRFDLKTHRGRFFDGRVVWVPTFTGGFLRWPAKLEAKYVSLLRAALAEPRRFSADRSHLLHALGRLPTVSVEDTMAAAREGDVVEIEAALGALAWNDRPAPALPILLRHLSGDRARVAAYALQRVARLLPHDQVVEAVASVLKRSKLRVTVHKEAVRLLGRYPTPAAIDLLRREWHKDLHRDVRTAALHAARGVLSEPVAWEVLDAASRDSSRDIGVALVDVHAPNVPDTHRKRYLRLMARVVDHDDTAVRFALFQSLRSWLGAEPDVVADLSARVLERLDPLDPWSDAAELLADGCRSQTTHARLAQCVERVRTAAEHATWIPLESGTSSLGAA